MNRIDLRIVLPTILLTAFGMLAIYSTGGIHYLVRQLLFLPVAVAGFLGAYFIPRRYLLGLAEAAYALGLALLALVLFFGTGSGSNRWFMIGPVALQPSEYAKLAAVLMLAKHLSAQRETQFTFRSLLLPVLICLAPALLVLAEPDLSTAILLSLVLAAMLYWNGLSARHILLLYTPLLSFAAGFSLYIWIPLFILLAIVMLRRTSLFRSLIALATSVFFGLLSPLSLRLLREYQVDRIRSFLAPWLDPHGVGWNAIQSRIAIGSGRFLGKGFLRGSQNRLGFLPNRHTDFVFSCIGEEFGFLGSVILLSLFGLLVYRFLLVASSTRDRFDSLLCIGCATVFAGQVFVNIGMLLGLLPITGIALPFTSYGGSSLLLSYIMVGLVLNVRAKPE
ncbi:MAG: FtsW/RodA/SpoVE family cell cycle protein [candidate division WOR-3 bacterium]